MNEDIKSFIELRPFILKKIEDEHVNRELTPFERGVISLTLLEVQKLTFSKGDILTKIINYKEEK